MWDWNGWADWETGRRARDIPDGSYVNLGIGILERVAAYGWLLTAISYSMLLKSVVVFVRPDWGLASIARVTPDTSRKLPFAGVMLITISVFLGYSVWRG